MNHLSPTALTRALMLALPALCSSAAHAQSAPTAPTVPVIPVTGRASAVGTLPAVTVTAPALRDLPMARTLVPPAPTSRHADSASLLADVPGMSLNAGGAISGLPALNGLADDRLRIRVDGMDLVASCPNHMNPPLSYIPPSQLGQIRVLPGITPVSVGGDSIGGTIVADSPAPVFAEPDAAPLVQGELGASVRSNNRARALNLSARYATETLALSYRGSVARADNYEAGGNFKSYDFTGRVGHTLGRAEVGSTAYDTRNHALALAFKRDAHLFEARLGWQDLPLQLYPNQRMDMLDNQQRSLNLSYQGQFGWGHLQARLYRETVDHFMDFGADKRFWYGNGAPPTGSGGPSAVDGTPCSPISATCAAGMPMFTEGQTTGASVKAELPLADADVLRLGAELQQYRINDWWPPSGAGMAPGTFWNIRDGRRDRGAVFAEWEAQPRPAWTTLLGARYERVAMDAGGAGGYNPATNGMAPMLHFQQRDGDAFNAQNHASTDHNLNLVAIAQYRTSPGLDIEIGAAHQVRSPNVYERFTWSTWQMAALMNNAAGDGNGYVGNLALKPEKARTLSATFDWHASDGSSGVKVSPFYTEVAEYIDAVQWNAATNAPVATPVVGRFSVLKLVNQSARLVGVNVSGHRPLGSTAVGDWGLKGVLSYTRGTNRDTGDQLYNLMPLNARLTLTHKTGGWNNALEWLLVTAKDQTNAMRNEVKTPGYALFNARFSRTWNAVRLDFGVDNLFDKHYAQPTGGAYVGQGTTMSNPALPNYPQWGVAVPGMGRSVHAGVNLRF